MQGASTINLSLSTTLTLTINTLTLSVYRLKHSKESRDPDEQYKQLFESEVDYQRNLEGKLK